MASMHQRVFLVIPCHIWGLSAVFFFSVLLDTVMLEKIIKEQSNKVKFSKQLPYVLWLMSAQ